MDFNRKLLVSFALVGILAVSMCRGDEPKEESQFDKWNVEINKGFSSVQGQIKSAYDNLSPEAKKNFESVTKTIGDAAEQVKKSAGEAYQNADIDKYVKNLTDSASKLFEGAKKSIAEPTKS